MSGKLYIKTFGCQMNEYDSAKMADVLSAAQGLSITDVPEEADVLLLNTCSVREKAQEKVFSQLGRWREWKAARPHLIIGVGGCVASQEGEAILERAPYVDLVFGPQTLHRLPALIDGVRQRGRAQVDVSFPEIEKFDALPEPRADGPTAFVSVMEGCSKYCTFCVVPYTRGEEVSRPFEDVLREVGSLAADGVREITLLGQNVNAYRGAMEDGDESDLATLIGFVAAIDGVDRVRFTTSHPVEFDDALIQAFAEVPELPGYLHLPVQSGSDRILSAMKRGHTVLEYKAKIRRLREARPDIALSTDLIVGFPGETERDHDATMDLVREIGFDQSFSFIYSQRPGTPAASLPDDVPLAVKKTRLAELQAQLTTQADAISVAMVGSVQRVLVERVSKKRADQFAGRTGNMRWVNFDGDARLIGHLVDVAITEAQPNSLRGRVVAVEERAVDDAPVGELAAQMSGG
jgi:tRNA-2-methylthio-N6-dimethylallyladenosine synthase